HLGSPGPQRRAVQRMCWLHHNVSYEQGPQAVAGWADAPALSWSLPRWLLLSHPEGHSPAQAPREWSSCLHQASLLWRRRLLFSLTCSLMTTVLLDIVPRTSLSQVPPPNPHHSQEPWGATAGSWTYPHPWCVSQGHACSIPH
uniref:Uncharacterized protein n=1 Tax=Rhinopithecus roxellana TaxID=61622 RepID=A0A2K6NNV9_RHIRO